MNAQLSFMQSETSENVSALLERVQSTDPALPDFDEDNKLESWGHYQFTAGSISPSTSLTSWREVGSVATAFKLIVAALKTCREARSMCKYAGKTKVGGFLSDVYLEQTLVRLEQCWLSAGGVCSKTNLSHSCLTSYF